MKNIDFTSMQKRNKAYAGANGSKISILYEGEQYMLKFPPLPRKNNEMSYSNSCFSEYLGCQIFESIGITVQKTLLGSYKTKDRQKVVVACGDFTKPGIVLQDFASLKNQIIDSARNGYGTELSDILQTLEEQTAVDVTTVTKYFWEMFIVDALIGNWDRHNGNWGFLYNAESDMVKLAPIYDCGSSLYPQADDEIMKIVLSNERERNYRVFEIPTSAIMIDGKKIKYFDFISSLSNDDCNKALEQVVPKINLTKINEIIEDMPFIDDTQKQFYKTMLKERKEKILDYSLEKFREIENEKNYIKSVVDYTNVVYEENEDELEI